jgi:hypothetical protein
MYIVLVAGSAKCRKSTAINQAYDFISKVEPKIKILSQKMTPEALIGSLSGMTGKDTTTVISEAEGIAIVDELSTLIDKNAFTSGMIPLLTKLFDGKNFDYETRSRGTELVANPCLSVLGGSTLHWIREAVPAVAVGGGFTSRIVFVYRDSFEKLVAWPSMSEENIKRGENIVADLKQVARMRGKVAFNQTARELFAKEYEHFIKTSSLFESPNLQGYAGRRHIILQKVCMVVSASMRDDRMINADDVRVGINILRNAEEFMPKVLRAISSEVIGSIMEDVLNIIKVRKVIARPALIRAMSHKLSARDLDLILETLLEKQAITVQEENLMKSYCYIRD